MNLQEIQRLNTYGVIRAHQYEYDLYVSECILSSIEPKSYSTWLTTIYYN